jgi:hypothetical protein
MVPRFQSITRKEYGGTAHFTIDRKQRKEVVRVQEVVRVRYNPQRNTRSDKLPPVRPHQL